MGQGRKDTSITRLVNAPSRGVFWLIDGSLFAFPFTEGVSVGIAKSGKTFNHKALWEHVRPKGCAKAFDYYPRGRVEFDGKGKPVIYMSPHIELSLIPQIKAAFCLSDDPVVRYDGSLHYRCYLDNGYTPQK